MILMYYNKKNYLNIFSIKIYYALHYQIYKGIA
jgi:hypothetical protein